jgi:hypothetical protein
VKVLKNADQAIGVAINAGVEFTSLSRSRPPDNEFIAVETDRATRKVTGFNCGIDGIEVSAIGANLKKDQKTSTKDTKKQEAGNNDLHDLWSLFASFVVS